MLTRRSIYMGLVLLLSATIAQAEYNLSYPGIQSAKTRANHAFGLNLSLAPVNVPFPMGYGFSGYGFINKSVMLGMDYLQASIALDVLGLEFGEIKERYLTLEARLFASQSFNFLIGAGSRTMEARLAKDLFDLATSHYSQVASTIHTNYLRFGIGNFWHFKKRFSFAIDYFTLNIPLSADIKRSAQVYAKNERDRGRIQDAENIVKWYPSATLFQLHFGMLF